MKKFTLLECYMLFFLGKDIPDLYQSNTNKLEVIK